MAITNRRGQFVKLQEWTAKNGAFTWIDVTDPSPSELASLAQTYGMVDANLVGCLDPEHMPRYEGTGDIRSLILRGYDRSAGEHALSVHQLTRKLVIFVSAKLVLTVHRTELPYLTSIWASYPATHNSRSSIKTLLHDMIAAALQTYDAPLAHLLATLSELEDRTFRPNQGTSLLEEGYFLRRKASVFNHMATLLTEALHHLADSFPKGTSHSFAYLAERSNRLAYHTRELIENIDNLLNLHLSIAAQKTNIASQKANEVMRLLTVVSIFFLPLNLIAGVYGMNFENMPELKNPEGYRLTLSAMSLIAFAILVWFWRKGWLSAQDDFENP